MKLLNASHRFFIILILSIGCFLNSNAQSEIDNAVFEKYFKSIDDFSGTVLVSVNGVPIFKKSYGFANLEFDIKNNIDTKFKIGSLTKQFTSMGIFILYDKGKLRLNDKISKYIDSLPNTWQNITIYQLLNHMSGLMHSWELEDFGKTMSIQRTLDENIKRFYNQPMLSVPGEKAHYSGLGYFILAKIIENISGMSYDVYMRKEIFDKLGMKNSGADNPRSILKNRASGYQSDSIGMRNSDYIFTPILTGGGDLYSTVDDLLLWDKAIYNNLLISDSTKNRIFTPRDSYGCGFGQGYTKIQKNADERSLAIPDSLYSMSHTGWVPGFSSRLDRFPDKKVLIVILLNCDNIDIISNGAFTQIALKEIYKR